MAKASRPGRVALIWAGTGAIAAVPVLLIGVSPYLAYRSAIYVTAGIAGAVALSLLMIQPLLAAGYLPGLTAPKARIWHTRMGGVLVLAVALHILGLYLTSAPDTLDALMLVAPTAFSVWGVLALWALIFTVAVVAVRRRLRLPAQLWYWIHNLLALLVVLGSVIHAVLIQGTMEPVSKWLLCLAVLSATAVAVVHLRLFGRNAARR